MSVDDDELLITDGDLHWSFDRTFLESRWTCLWGNGCHGILDVKASELGQGCCSVGAEIEGDDEAHMVEASAVALAAERFQHRAAYLADGPFNADRTNTAVVDGACIFLNRPGFAGGAGCALHLGAVAAGESPIDWKPSVCWQLPLRVEWTPDETTGIEHAHMRRWSRADWGPEGETMAWCCTEGSDAYVGTQRVIDSLGEEIEAITGSAVFVELRRRLGPANES